ncbi:hypothetical protein V3C99_013825, partial [Haemonchus contortus]
LQISEKPKFKPCTEEVIEVGKSEDITFSAEFDGQDDVVATCFFNGSPVREDSKTQLLVQRNSVNFLKKQPTKADSGEYTVKLSGEFGEITRAFTVKVKDVPGPPAGVSIDKIEGNTISIAWEKPSDDGGEPITGYLIKKKEAGRRTFKKVVQVSDMKTSQILEDLKMATDYVLSVAAINKYGVGEAVETPVITTCSPSKAPQITQPPIIFDVSSDSCVLKWDKPKDDGRSPICGYDVFLRENAGEWTKVNSELVSATHLSVQDLRQGITYEFKVEAVNETGISSNSDLPSEPLTIASTMGTLPRGAKPDVTAKDALVNITKPLEAETFGQEEKPVVLTVDLNGPVKAVKWTKDGEVITASEKFELSSKGTSCSLTIKHANVEDAGRYMVQVDGSTSSTNLKISGKPKFKSCTEEVVEVGKSEDIMFSAEFEGQDDDVIATCFFNGSPVREDSKTQLIIHENSVKFSKKLPTKADSGEYTVKLSGDFGEITKTFTVKVKGVPGPPTGISVNKIESNSISIAWENPADEGGEPITGYLIKKKEAGRRAFQKIAQVSGTNTSQVVGDLKKATDYVFSVAAINKFGVGETVETPVVTTDASFKAPQITQRPVVSDVSSDGCQLKWDQPSDDGGSPICGYNVYLRDNAREWTKVNSELVTDTCFPVKDLCQGVAYEFKVEALNKAGIQSNSNLPSEPLTITPISGQSAKNATPDVTAAALATITKPLECETFGNAKKPVVLTVGLSRPAKDVIWTKDGNVITASERFEMSFDGTSCSLTIKDSDSNDAGRYMVQVDKSQSFTDLKISGKPKFNPCSEEVIEVGKSEDITFSAEFDGQDDVVATCFFNGSPVREDSKTQLAVQGNSVNFLKKQPTKADSGEYTVKLSGDFGEITRAFTVKVKDVPGPPAGISVDKVGGNMISITWEKPSDDGGEPVTGYVIKKKEAGRRTFKKVVQVSDMKTSQIVEDLKMATDYVLSVAAVNKYGVGEAVETPVITTASPFKAPQVAQPPVISDVSSDSCVLKWDKPKEDGGSAICGYDVFFRENAGEWRKVNSELVSATHLSVKDLRQGITYEFKVEAVNESGISSNSNLQSEPLIIAPSSDHIITDATSDAIRKGTLAEITKPLERKTYGTKGKPVVLTVDLNHSAKEIKWTKDGKVITASDKFELSSDGMSCSLTIKDSDPGDTGRYMVHVDESQSFTDLKISGKPKFKSCTQEVIEVGKSEDIMFSAEFDGQDDVIATCFFNGHPVREDSKTQLVVHENLLSFLRKLPTKADSGEYTVKLSGEFGEITKTFTVKVKDMPGPPMGIAVNSVNDDSISISWEKPLDDGGEPITGYVIMGKEACRRTFQKIAQVSDMTTSQIVEDLKISTGYVLSVAAVNKYGVGEAVETPVITTGSPFKAPLITQRPVVSDIRSNSCVLRWEKPEGDGGSPIYGYEVFLKESGGEWTKANNELIFATHFSVGGLRQGGVYEFKIEAVNEAGLMSNSSLSSEPVAITSTSGLPTTAPSVPRITITGTDSVTVGWDVPENIAPAGFTIAYKSESSPVWAEVNCDVNFCRISGLREDVDYVFKVAIRNEFGVGTFSEQTKPIRIIANTPPVVIKALHDVVIAKKQTLRLECHSSGQPAPEFTWYKDGVEIIPQNQNVEIVSEGHISRLLVHDVNSNDCGSYSCEIGNPYGITRSTASVTVTDVQCHFETSFSEYREVVEGEDHELCCTVSDEDGMVVWYKDGKELTMDDHILITSEGKTRNLKILSAEDADSGTYRCETSDGRSKTEGEVVVKGQEPRISVGPQDLTVDKFGTVARLHCEITKPGTRVLWFKNGQEIWPQTDKYIIATSSNTSTLEIHNTEKGDIGDYWAALNELEVSAPARLTLLVAPDIIIRENLKDEVELKTHEELAFHVEAVGYPNPAVTILHKDSRIQNRATVEEYDNVTSVRMKNLNRDDCGTVKITAENSVGTVHKEIRLTVLDVPSEPLDLNSSETTMDSTILSWSGPERTNGAPITGFIIERKAVDSSRWRSIGRTDGNTFCFKATNLFSGQTYGFRVIAVNSVGEGSPSLSIDVNTVADAEPEVVTTDTLLLQTPVAPEAVLDGAKAVLSWAPVPNADLYHLERQCDDDEWLEIAQIEQTDFIDSLVSKDGSYRYRVIARNPMGASIPSNSSATLKVRAVEESKENGRKGKGNDELDRSGDGTEDGKQEETSKPTPKKTLNPVDDIVNTKQRLKKRKPIENVSTQQNAEQLPAQSLSPPVKPVDDFKFGKTEADSSTGEADIRTTDGTNIVATSSAVPIPTTTKRVKPRIQLESSSVDVKSGERAILKANVQGGPELNCVWKKDGKIVKTSRAVSSSYRNGVAELEIKDVKPSHSGTYCLSVNSASGTDTADIALTVQTVPSAPEGPLEVSITGKSCRLSWSAPLDDGHSELIGYSIEKYDEKLRKWMFIARCTENVHTLDRLPPGSSHCFRVSAENAVGRGPSIESEKVKTSEETTLRMEKPTAISSAGSIIAMWKPLADDDVNYIVEIKEAKSRRSWKTVTAEPVKGDSYAIRGLNPGSEYIVRVTAVNSESQGVPSEESEAVKYEDVREKPSFVSVPKDTTAVKGSKIKLTAEFTGIPTPEVRWMKNRKEMFSGARQWTEISDGVSSLSITEIREEDEGDYTIELRNAVGTCEHRFKLNMDVQPEIIRPDRYTSTLVYDEGDTVKLRLSFTGRPAPTVEWLDNNGQLISNSERFIVDNVGLSTVLTIRRLLLTDRGEFKLRVWNRCGEDTFPISIQITDRPGPPGRPSVQDQNVDSVRLLWSAPTQDGGSPVRFYTVEKCTESERVWTKAETTKQPFVTLFNLKHEEAYLFRIRADNTLGQSEPSEESDVIYVKVC